MKTNATNPRYLFHIVLVGTLAAVSGAVGCSKNRPAESLIEPPAASAQRVNMQKASLQTVALPTSQPEAVTAPKVKRAALTKPPAPKVLTYRSRDYGISFDYPWQYAYVSAKTMGSQDPSANDSDNQQLTLARVEIPNGFYPDTDFETGTFTVGLNQSVNEDACYSTVAAKGSEVKTETINAIPFRWSESEEGGRGKAMVQRTYVTFANDTCYRLQMMVKTSNENGMARELDPEQVLRRLDAMLKTVKIAVKAPEVAPEPVATLPSTSATENK